jgi:hypothetical protein
MVDMASRLAGAVVVAGVLAASGASATGPVAVKNSSRNEATPAAAGPYFAWAKSRSGRPRVYDVWVEQPGQRPIRVNPPNTEGDLGGIDGTRLVYQQMRGIQSNIAFFDLASRRHSDPPPGVNSRRWEWRPVLSGDWLLYARGLPYSVSLQTLLLRNMLTGEERTLDSLRMKNAILLPGDVTGNFAVWMKCVVSPRRCNVFRYDIGARKTTRIPSHGYFLYGPSVTSTGTMYLARSRRGCGSSVKLMRVTLDGKERVLYSFSRRHDMLLTSLVELSPGSVRVYFDRVTCRTRRFDIYRIDDSL